MLKKTIIILGANGNGNLMYAETNSNVTQQLIEYSNNKYNNEE